MSEPKGPAPAGSDTSTLEPTDIECYDCDQVYPFEGAAECPEDPEGHGYGLLHVSKEPLGYDDDDEYFHRGRRQYEYAARED